MPVKQHDVISRLKSGEALIRVNEHVSGEFRPFQYLSGGGRVTARTYEKLTTSEPPLLMPLSLGLFPDAEPQEWGWVDE